MNLKNYTSTVDPGKSQDKIKKCLINVGASSITEQYENKICTGISFLIFDKKLTQTIPFRLKAQVEECFKIFWDDRTSQGQREKYRAGVLDQANRTAWKILSDWVEIQCSMILLGQAEPVQMFLSYVFYMNAGETFYEKIISGKTQLQLSN